MPQIKKVLPIAILVIALIGLAVWKWTPARQMANQKVTIGFQASPPMALLMVAKEKGFFAEEGLDVELKEFTAGKLALQAFLGGSLDYAVSGDVPAALALMQGNSFIIPTQVVGRTQNEVRIVARKDTATTSKDYFTAAKRKLATSIGGGPEFFTYEFFSALNIPKDWIEIIAQSPSDMPAALSSGSVDAIAVFDPFAYFAEKQLGASAITFVNKDIYSELYVLEAKETDRSNPDTLHKLLQALSKAEKFISSSPEESKDIVVKYTKLDRVAVDATWSNTEFQLALTSQLLDYWQREFAWAKATEKIKPETELPDFKENIFTDPLKKISPSSVEIP